MLAYHISDFKNLKSILKRGLTLNNASRTDHVGKGIYVFFDKRYAIDTIEHLNIGEDDEFGRALVITVDCADNTLLMDEDSLYIDIADLDRLYGIMPEEAVAIYAEYLRNRNDIDELPINDPNVAKFKIGLIDKYQIKPSESFTTNFGNYDILTARTLQPPKVLQIEVYMDDEIMSLDMMKIIINSELG